MQYAYYIKRFKQLWLSTMKSEDTEEWLDVWFTRPIGLFFALIWRRLGVHPNTITILSIFLGIGAALMFYHADLWHNIAGVALLMFANFCDSTDGQLARMTGQKTLVGRVLDGFAGDVWFFCIYAAICLRLMPEFMPGTDMAWGFWIWALGYVAGILCHTRQASLADYYRQIHLLFLKGREGSELDSYESQHAIYENLPDDAPLFQRIFYYNYQNYCKNQELRTPEFQKFYSCVMKRYGCVDKVPKDLRERFRMASKPLMPLTNILSFNVRAICIYVTCLMNCPWVYFVFEIVVLGPIYLYMQWKHETICKEFVRQITDGDALPNTIIFDFGGTLDTNGQHWARFMWNAYRRHGVEIEWEDFLPAYIYAEKQLGREPLSGLTTISQLVERKVRLQKEYLSDSGWTNGHMVDDETYIDVVAALLEKQTAALAYSKEILMQLRKHVRLALVSNYYGNLTTVLKEYEMDGLFDVVIDSAVVGVRKPDSRIFSIAIEQLGCSPHEVMVVGDSLKNDIQPAQQLGCQTVWLNVNMDENFNHVERNKSNASTSVKTINDLSQLLGVLTNCC